MLEGKRGNEGEAKERASFFLVVGLQEGISLCFLIHNRGKRVMRVVMGIRGDL